jgi:molybdopterin adenylyltransferase
MKIARVTLSDRASAGVYADRSGPEIERVLAEHLGPGHTVLARLLPDDRAALSALLIELCDVERCDLVVTTGGTGPAPRDVTPEATERVCEKMLPGFGELMRSESLKYVPTAILSRQTAGICGRALVVNLPGRPRSIRQCLDAVFPAIPYCIDLIHTGAADPPRLETKPERLVAFRPKG